MSAVGCNDREFMESPHLWAHFPFLPVKRRGADRFQELGCLMHSDPLIVVRANVFQIYHLINTHSFRDLKEHFIFHRYDSLDEVLNDEWRVD